MIDRKFKFLVLALFVVMVVNCFLHVTHPAYRYYQDNVSRFRDDYNLFVKKVQHDLIPTILTVSSNSVFSCSSVTNFVSSVNATNSVAKSCDDIPTTVVASYGIAGGCPFFRYDGLDFTVGDDFFGFTILDIRPTIIITEGRVFLISSSSKIIHPISRRKL